jgi:hypothetical protein
MLRCKPTGRPGATDVDFLDQIRLDPDVDIRCVPFYTEQVGRCRAHRRIAGQPGCAAQKDLEQRHSFAIRRYLTPKCATTHFEQHPKRAQNAAKTQEPPLI